MTRKHFTPPPPIAKPIPMFDVVYRDTTKWDMLWIDQAQRYSEVSKDRSTKVGCVLVKGDIPLSQGWNGFARGVDDDVDERHERPEKYKWVIHAELNAILNHARHGGPGLIGCVAYMNYRPGVCSHCVACLAQVGVTAIVGPTTPFPGVGRGKHYDVDIAPIMAFETNIKIWAVDYDPIRK